MGEFIQAAKLAEVPAGRGVTVTAGGRSIALFNVDGEILALEGACPHRAGPLGEGVCEDGHVYCPMHGWKFDIRSGLCAERPDRPAQTLAVRIQGETIEVEL